MRVLRKSPLTGDISIMDLDITSEQLAELSSPNRRKIQEIFPELSPDEREFLLTGYTPEDWEAMFRPEEE